MESNSSEFIQIIDGVKHLDIVCNQEIIYHAQKIARNFLGNGFVLENPLLTGGYLLLPPDGKMS